MMIPRIVFLFLQLISIFHGNVYTIPIERYQNGLCIINENITGSESTPKQGINSHGYPQDWSWTVALFERSADSNEYHHFCGGSIISKNCILTAGSCVFSFTQSGVSRVFVGTGSSELNSTTKLPINKIIVHPNYNSLNHYSDIALIFTSSPIELNEQNKSVCLSGPSSDNIGITHTYYGTGWGKQSLKATNYNNLEVAKLELVSNQQCNKAYSKLKNTLKDGIRNDQLCARPKNGSIDTCYGFGGGPLTTKLYHTNKEINNQVGIVSFSSGCGDPNYPGVYTRVTQFVPWIKQQLANN